MEYSDSFEPWGTPLVASRPESAFSVAEVGNIWEEFPSRCPVGDSPFQEWSQYHTTMMVPYTP